MTAPLSLSDARYQIPDWFLERNVKTAAELSAAPDQINFCTCGECKEAKADDDGGGGADLADEDYPDTPDTPDKAGQHVEKDGVKEPNDSWSSSLARGLCPDEIKYKTFAELRDTTAAAFVTHRDGKLLRPEASAVVFRMEKEEWDETDSYITSTSIMEPVWMGRAVERVAKALGVSLVTLGLEDLEELGGEFYRQDQEAQECKTSGDVALPLASTSERHEKDGTAKEDGSTETATSIEESGNKDQEAEEAEDVDDDNEHASSTQQKWEPDVFSLSEFLDHFFAARSERNADSESWQRTQLAWTLILDAVRAKLATERTASVMPGGTIRPSAVIFHVTDYPNPNFGGYRLKRRVLARFAEMVQQRRGQGDAWAIIVSTEDSSLEPDEKLQRKLGAGRPSTMVARDVKLSDADLATRKQSYRGIINARALRRCLRQLCAHLFPADLLKVTADWACAERGKSFTAFGGKMWTSTEMGHIVTQIMGRAWLKPELRFADVRVILKRLDLYNPVEPETQDTPATPEKVEVEDNDNSIANTPEDTTSEEEVTEVLTGLDLNEHEQELAKCIVEPGTLNTRWDDVIIDQETKELMQQFVASHLLQFDCASELLREALRIRGALLYGPPGTGKTQLSRAVATASGSRMLAVSYTSLISKYSDETGKYIEAAFTLAGKLHPCVLFMDEVDSLFYRRSSSDNGWERAQTNQLLQQMDALPQNEKAPLVLVATNRPWDLDEAFLRRLQHKVYFGLPDIDARARILALFLHQDDLDPSVDINGLAQVTEKYSGSDLKTLCAKAGLLWEAEQARLHTLYKSVSDKFAMASNAPKKVRLGIDHFAKALDEIQPSNSIGLAKDLEEFRRKHNPTASPSGKDPGIRLIYNSSTKRYDRFGVRDMISKPTVSDDVPTLKQDEPENEMQLQIWRQLDLHAHLMHCLNTRLAVLLFCSQRILEHQMPLQAWCQMDLRTHLMHRLHTNLIALLFCLHTYDHSVVTLQQTALDSKDSTAAGSNSKNRQKTQKTRKTRKTQETQTNQETKTTQETQNTQNTQNTQDTQKTAPRNKFKLKENVSVAAKMKGQPTASKEHGYGSRTKQLAATVNFRYTPLGTDEFRLLEISPGDIDAPLVCTLKHASFQSSERYCALSYTWGSPEPPFFIKCNGSDVRVTRSLHEAMGQMRRTWCPVTIWADAICINQGDNSEKSQQVMRMGEIYSKASRLFVWLGNPVTASDADVAVDAMKKLERMVASICLEHQEESWVRGALIMAMQESGRDESISENEWQKLQGCFLMPWFSRVWVFQEVALALASSPEIIRMGYGNRSFSWMTVIRITAILEQFKSVNPVSIRCPTALTMERNITMETLVRQVHVHLHDRMTEEDVVKALARKPLSDGHTLLDHFQIGGLATNVAIVIDLCRPIANKNVYPQLDLDIEAALMVEAVLGLLPHGSYLELPAMDENLSKELYGVLVDCLAQSALWWCLQCSPDDEWWLPENPAILKLRRSVGFVTATLLKQHDPSLVIAVWFKAPTFSFMPGLKQRLWTRLQLARRLGATDPRDKLYAFLGIFSEDVADEPLLQVDYNSSVADVYVNLTIYFLQRLMCLDVLEFVNDRATEKPRLANLPSWAIDLSSPTDLELFQNETTYNAGGACSLGRGFGRFPMHVLQVRVSNDRRRLDLNAYLVGEVTELAFLPHHYEQNVDPTGNANRNDHGNVKLAAAITYGLALNIINGLGQSTRDCKDVNMENPAVNNFPASADFDVQSGLYVTGQSMYEAFWRCLLCEHWAYQLSPDASVSLDGRERVSEQGYRDYHTMIAKASICIVPPGGDGDAMSERSGSPGWTPTEASFDNYLFSIEYEPIAQTRVFGVVADKLIGWFPRRAEKGDVLAILPGARCPYVLRKVRGDAAMGWDKHVNEDYSAQKQDQRSEWEVIGHAYVQGLMDDIVTEWQIGLTENGKEILGKLNASGQAPAVERICLV